MKDFWIVAILWLVLSVIGEYVVGILIQSWPPMAALQGQITARADFVLLRIGVVVFVLVTLLIFYSAFRWRTKPDDTRDSAHQKKMNPWFAWSWLTFSAVLNVLFIIYPGVTGLSELWTIENDARTGSGPLEVDVTAQQWQWTFSYPEYNLEDKTSLILPTDRPVQFVLKTKDVIHSFWVPAFGIKRDVIPGETTRLLITPTMVTSTADDPMVRVQCAELCGVGHADMRAPVKILSQDNFTAWIKDQKGGEGGMQMGMNSSGTNQQGGT